MSVLVAQMVQLMLHRGLQTGLHDRHTQVSLSWGWALLPECRQALATGSCLQPDGTLNFNKAIPRITRAPLLWICIVATETLLPMLYSCPQSTAWVQQATSEKTLWTL